MVTKFQDFVRYNFLVAKHPHVLHGPQRLRNMRIDGRTGMIFMEQAVSDFISDFERNLPLSEFGESEFIRATWVSAFLVKQAAGVRQAAITGGHGSGDERGGRKSKKRTTPGDTNTTTKEAKRPRTVSVAELADTNFMVRVRGSALQGRIDRQYSGVELFEDLVRWINSSGNLTGRFFRLHAVYRCTLSSAEATLSGVDEGEEFRNPVHDQDSWNSELQNFRSVCPSGRTLLLEADLEEVGEGDDAGKMVLRSDTGKASAHETVISS